MIAANTFQGLAPSGAGLVSLSTSGAGPETLSMSPIAAAAGAPYEDVVEMAVASSLALKAPLDCSGIFNPDVPDLSSCVPADESVNFKTESDQFLTVDVSELFPELMDLNNVSAAPGLDSPTSKPTVGTLNLLGSISEETSDAEVSPAETEASLDHFFNTFTDLTGFLENLSEGAGSTILDDNNSAVFAGHDNNTTDTTGEPSIGDLCTNADDPAETEEPPAKRVCNSQSSTRTRQTYRERRNKNNVASRRSRSRRRNKFTDMEDRADDLESENEHLRKKIEELTQIAEESRECLIKVLQNK